MTAQLAYCTVLPIISKVMESIITVNINHSFSPTASSQIKSDSDLVEALNIRHEIRAISLDISQAFDTVWHLVMLSKLSAYGIQGQLHSWILTSSTLVTNV